MSTPFMHATAKRYDKYWLHDGSVVLHVEDTLFRVHQSTLARVSETFRDLFSMPQPEHEARLDGCPVVRLEGDSSEDWVYLLDAIYDHSVSIGSQALDVCLDSTLSILRLATKYRLVAFRKRCIDALFLHFPSEPAFISKNRKTWPSLTQIVRVARVARETNALTLLPCAYLFCVALLSEDCIYGLPLPPAHKLSLYHGISGLLRAQKQDLLPFVHKLETFKECKMTPRCLPYTPFKKYLRNTDIPYWTLSCVVAGAAVRDFCLCSDCSERAYQVIRAGAQRTWKRLPEIFDLAKDWEELRRIQDYDSMSEP